MVRQTNKEKLSITLDVEVFEFVSTEAVKDDRSVSSMINVILRNYMNEKKKD
ncbi:ribbon-helix-helix domain-containing protein [Paenibacillus sp. FSL L8-0499]|uniref:ribbon-helix-helix domain-containing protein n=1 Tax=Paenibacillus sp. FSL L8-0499 TaxID=2975334 RepID=UPI0030F70CE7